MRKRTILLIVILLMILTLPLFSQGEGILNINTISGRALITGAAIGLGISIYHGVLLFGYTPNVPINEKLIGFSIPAVVSIVTSILSTELFFHVFSNETLNKWLFSYFFFF